MLSQPWPFVGGHLVSAVVGILCVRWVADPVDPAAWDALANDAWPELVRRTLGTERSRQACVDFIRSLHDRGVNRAKP